MNSSHSQEDIVLSVCCLAYNHEPYIRNALDAFVGQQVRFRMEIIIHDDCSTDKTTAIIDEYQNKNPELIKVIRQSENQYSLGIKPIFNYVFPAARGKYIALCEGDDFWTDPYKLQKQVDFLENNPQYSGAYHATQVMNEIDGTTRLFRPELKVQYTAEDTFSTTALFHTSSIVFRTEALLYPHFLKNIVSGDMALFSILTAYGPLGLVEGVMSVYRKNSTGVTESSFIRNSYHEKRIELMQYLNEFHGYRFQERAKAVIAHHEMALSKDEPKTTRLSSWVNRMRKSLNLRNAK
jgi:glycosyltransferase involved in cell wall biosynthesis